MGGGGRQVEPSRQGTEQLQQAQKKPGLGGQKPWKYGKKRARKEGKDGNSKEDSKKKGKIQVIEAK